MKPSRQPPLSPGGGQVPVPRATDPTALREWMCVPDGDMSLWDSWAFAWLAGGVARLLGNSLPDWQLSFCPHRLGAEAFARPAEGPGDSFS